MNKWISKFLNVDLSVDNAGDVECIVSEKTSGCSYKLAFSNKDTEKDIIGRIGKEIYSWISLMHDEVGNRRCIMKKIKMFDDERELKDVENILVTDLGVPYVRCSYDSHCSHKAKDTDELDYRRQEEMLKPDEYIINYELYKTKEDYEDNKGGYDGEVYELIYAIEDDCIVIREYYK